MKHRVGHTHREKVTQFHYDPNEDPDPQEWLALDEGERIVLVEDYHRKKRIRLPNARMHAVIHVVVENQIALGGEIPAKQTLVRLMRQGLDRHDAVHAIGSVLFAHMSELLKAGAQGQDSNATYYAELHRLTAKSWRSSFKE